MKDERIFAGISVKKRQRKHAFEMKLNENIDRKQNQVTLSRIESNLMLIREVKHMEEQKNAGKISKIKLSAQCRFCFLLRQP